MAPAYHVIQKSGTVGLGQFVGWDSASTIQMIWGKEAILSIRHVKITIANENQKVQKQVRGYFDRLVTILSLSRNLRKLEVEWCNYHGMDESKIGDKRMEEKVKIYATMRRADGTRANAKHFRHVVSRWTEGEQILKPLERFRGVPEAVVIGCVTDKSAEYLEIA